MVENELVEKMKAEQAEAEASCVIEHEDGSVSIELAVPIERKNGRIESVTLRRPTADELVKLDLNAVENGNLATCIPFLHAISDITAAEVQGMDGADFMFVANVAIRRFFRRRPRQLARAAR